MLLYFTDYNGADDLFAGRFSQAWGEIAASISGMPIHVKGSDQAGIQGKPIFGPVGTNQYLKATLMEYGWLNGIPIPTTFQAWGTDVDFAKDGVVMEVQFSNYPFLLNNALRSELLIRSRTRLPDHATEVAVIVTKGHMMPAANSTLYYEQAVNQLNTLDHFRILETPLRLVGLFEPWNEPVPGLWSTYASVRYTRTVDERRRVQCTMLPPSSARGRATIQTEELLEEG